MFLKKKKKMFPHAAHRQHDIRGSSVSGQDSVVYTFSVKFNGKYQ